MGVSIYYSFKVKSDLKSSGYLKEIEDEWNQLFNGSPYESWSWYEPEVVTKRTLTKSTYKYVGATGLLLKEDPEPLVKALSVLTKIRKKVGGYDWAVNLDDMKMPWVDNSYAIEI